MKKYFNHVLCALVLCATVFSSVQAQDRCATNEHRAANLLANPALVQQRADLETFTQAWIANRQNSGQESRVVETVSVVVHVLYKNATENISDAQIESQLEVLNEDFRKLNSNASQTASGFQGIAADTEIEFCLATTDPNGDPTSGITRTLTTVAGIGDTDNWYSTANGGKDSWDYTKYINIWVCDLGDEGLLGFASIPNSADPPESDGMVIGHQYFGTTGTAANSFPNDGGRTVTHEMGHYFNLEHLWGEEEGGCNEDDFVSDTPNQFTETEGCLTFPAFDACTTSGNGINYNNYMDYSYDECMSMFTEGQKMRMLAALNGPRADLLSNSCAPVVGVNDRPNLIQVQAFPNPASNHLTIQLEEGTPLNGHRFWLSDAVGREVLELAPQQMMSIDVSGLHSGIYFLRSDAAIDATRILISK
ncbi:MAG: M43 family zinc metalloprotease [Saprospiraceae bacterium]